jgi:hypothetical protein
VILAATTQAGAQVQSNVSDFYQPGTQPMGLTVGMQESLQCQSCHGNYAPEEAAAEPWSHWAASMMGQSARDPVFYAALTIANQDAEQAGVLCIRCHAPNAFLEGRAVAPGGQADGSNFTELDLEGINCNFCHRAVNPVYIAGQSPSQDQAILANLTAAGHLPYEGTNAQYVVDPADNRRGPFTIPFNPHFGFPQPQVLVSPFHQKAEFCWQCHGVSNPMLMKQGNGSYQLDPLQAPHASGVQTDMFPLHRTYHEWLNSYYSTVGVQHNGRFGGNHPTGIMKTCQDCHMPDINGSGCNLGAPFPVRPDMPEHTFMGSNTWVLAAVLALDTGKTSGLTPQSVADTLARNEDFLARASDLEVTLEGDQLMARVFNRTGHKLPTGFPDGRRVWINVKFFNLCDDLIEERGAYDFDTATLTAADTKVYEAVLGIDTTQAAATGLPEGHTFHFILANTFLKDNRIPAAGHSAFLAPQFQTAPVGATYVNGQHWDDTLYDIPPATARAVVTVYYQVTSKEFIEFLRDANETDNRGQIAYDQWVLHGRSQPVVMDMAEIELEVAEDLNDDGRVDVTDLLQILATWGTCPKPPTECPEDIDGSGFVDVGDLLAVLAAWGNC